MRKRSVFAITLIAILAISIIGIVQAVNAGNRVRVIITVDKDFDERTISSMNGMIIARGRLFPIVVAELPEKALSGLSRAEGVVKVEYDSEVHTLAKPPSPPGKGKKGGSSQPPQVIPWGVDRINAPEAWGGDEFNGTIEVAVIDTGVDYNHPDVAGNIAWGVGVLHGRISEKQRDYIDRNGHGTHVAGTIAALNNTIGVVGVSPGVEIYAIKALGNDGSGRISDIILGIEQALLGPDGILDSDGDGIIAGDPDDDSAEVISMSFGGSADVQSLHNAIIDAYNYGILLVAASGNDGSGSPVYPAVYPEVIAVGATDQNDNVAYFSNRGSELTAPGVDILSTYPDDTYKTLSGTSMATPHVSGVAALIQSVHFARYGTILPPGNFTDTDSSTVRGILHIASDDLGPTGWDVDYGYGIVRADLAVQSSI